MASMIQWKPLAMLSNENVKEETATKNLYEKINSIENSIRTSNQLSRISGTEKEHDKQILEETMNGDY